MKACIESFNIIFKFFKRWYKFETYDEKLWDKMYEEAITLPEKFSPEAQKELEKINIVLGESNRTAEPVTLGSFFFMQYIDQRQKKKLKPLDFETYYKTFSDMYELFKGGKAKQSDFIETVKEQYKEKDEYFAKFIISCFKLFLNKDNLYKQYTARVIELRKVIA